MSGVQKSRLTLRREQLLPADEDLVAEGCCWTVQMTAGSEGLSRKGASSGASFVIFRRSSKSSDRRLAMPQSSAKAAAAVHSAYVGDDVISKGPFIWQNGICRLRCTALRPS